MTARPDTAAVAESAVGTKPQRGEVNQEKGQNQMTREDTELAGGLSSGEWTVDPSTLWVVSTADNGYRVHVADVRGWGYLTGRGDVCLKLDSEPAYEIQKAWGAHIAAANPATILKLIASARSAPPPSVEVFGSSSLKGEDTHRDADGAVLADEPIGAGEPIGNGRFIYRTTLLGERHVVDAATGFVWFKLPYDYRYTDNATQRRTAEAIIAALAAPASDTTAGYEGSQSRSEPKPSVEVERLREALAGLLDHTDKETCQHEDTHRGGHIWTICDGCGRKWADDEGGFVPYSDAPAVAAARATLSRKQEPGVPTPGGEGK